MSKIILKKSSVVDKVPLASDLDYGELALNYADSKLFFKKADNTVGVIGGGAGSALQNRYSYTATAAQTTFSASYTPPYVDVYLNGLRLSSGVDYTATSGSTVVLTEAAAVNDLVEIVAQVASTTVLVDDTKLPLAGGTMTGVISFTAGQTFPGTQNALVSGTSIKTINGNSVLGSGNIQIDGGVVSFNTRTGAVTLSSTDVTTALGFTPVTQTAVDSSISALVDSAPGTLDTLNELAAALGDDPNFATTVSTSIAARLPLAGGTMTGAIGFAGAQTWPTFNQSTTGNAATATALQTARTINGVSFNGSANITVADATKLPLAGGSMTGLLIGRESAGTNVNTMNDAGSFSVRSNASNAASISFHRTGAYAINMGLGTDNVFVIGGWSASSDCFRMDGSGNLTMLGNVTYKKAVNVISGSTTAVTGQVYVLVASLTLTLPASPVAGNFVSVSNRSGTTTAVIARNGQNIMGLAENMTVDSLNANITLTFADTTRGWVLVS
jgi:hypothetical protein